MPRAQWCKQLTNRRTRFKGRSGGTFTAIPHAVQDSENWRKCSHPAIRLLLDLARQFKGHNNGDLCAAMKTLAPMGWTSSDTVTVALKELRHYGLITLTRQGGLHRASLYAITWHPIDPCDGKLDVMPTSVAPGDWKISKPTFRRPPKKKRARPPGGAKSNPLTPSGGVDGQITTPLAGAKTPKSTLSSAPPDGALLRYIPSGAGRARDALGLVPDLKRSEVSGETDGEFFDRIARGGGS